MVNCVSVYFTTNCRKRNGKGRPPAKQNETGLQHDSGWSSDSYLSSWLFIQIIVFIIMHFNVHTDTAGITLERNCLDPSHVYPPIQEKSVINVKKNLLKYHTVLYLQVSSEQHMKREKVPLILWVCVLGMCSSGKDYYSVL